MSQQTAVSYANVVKQGIEHDQEQQLHKRQQDQEIKEMKAHMDVKGMVCVCMVYGVCGSLLSVFFSPLLFSKTITTTYQ